MKIGEIPANKIEELERKIQMHLRVVAEELIGEIEGAHFLSRKEQEVLCQRAVADPVVALRVKIHSQAWTEDVVGRLAQLVNDSVGQRLQRAARIYRDKDGAQR